MPGIFHNPAAFSPFFDSVIIVEGSRRNEQSPSAARKVSGTFKALVSDNGFADPFAPADAETNVRTYSVSVRAGDWIERTPPQVGDRITLAAGVALAVSRVETITGDVWSMTAKEVAA